MNVGREILPGRVVPCFLFSLPSLDQRLTVRCTCGTATCGRYSPFVFVQSVASVTGDR